MRGRPVGRIVGIVVIMRDRECVMSKIGFADSPVPKFLGELSFCQERLCHCNNGLPFSFDEPVLVLSVWWGCLCAGAMGTKQGCRFSPNQLGVKVTLCDFGKSASVNEKFPERFTNIGT